MAIVQSAITIVLFLFILGVLGVIVARALYERYPKEPEGNLSKRYNALVDRETCAEVGREIGVPKAADFYLCGPAEFLADLRSGLGSMGIPAEQLHVELFASAPASMKATDASSVLAASSGVRASSSLASRSAPARSRIAIPSAPSA